jgi:hypothetical protein
MGKCGKGSLTRIGKMEGGSRRFSTCIADAFGLLHSLKLPCSSLMKHNLLRGRFNLRRHATEAAFCSTS